MKAALAILLIFIGGFLLYEVLSGNASTILATLQGQAKGPATPVTPSGAAGGGAAGAF